jgi:hypothetical protein
MTIDDRMGPESRGGLLGVWDRLVGPGADPVETGLIVGAMVAGPGLAAAWALASGVDWAWWQWLVVVLIAGDLVGGLAANALAPAKRWHHRAGQGPRAHFSFAMLHLHPFLLALAMPDALSLRAAVIIYGLLLTSAGLVIAASARLKAAVALLCAAAAVALCSIWLPAAGPASWLPVVLYLKVIVAFLVPLPDPPEPRGPWS